MENVNNTVNKLTEMLANVISERDKLKEDNENLKDQLGTGANQYAKAEAKNLRLSDDNALLIEALEVLINDKTFLDDVWWFNDSDWDKIDKAKEILNNIKK